MRYRLVCVLGIVGCLAFSSQGYAGISPENARVLADETIADMVMLNNAIADEYFHQGDFPQAVVALERVIRLNPQDVTAYASAGWLLWSDGNTEDAARYYQRLVEMRPTDPEAYFEMGLFHYRLGHFNEAATWFTQANDLGLPAPKRHFYGHTLEKAGRRDEALAFWRSVLADDPTSDLARRMIESLTAPSPQPNTTTE